MSKSKNTQHEHAFKFTDLRSLALAGQKFDQVIAGIKDYATIMLSPDGTIVTWNKGAEKMNEYSAEEVIGRNFRIFYPTEDILKEHPEGLLKEAAKQGTASDEGWQIRKDGSRFWGEVIITALQDEEIYPAGFLKFTNDLTPRKNAEERLQNTIEELRIQNEELRKSRDRYHGMMSEVQDYAIILLDVNGKILDWNKGAEKLKGYKMEEIVGKSFRMFYPAEDKERNLPQQLLDTAKENGYVTHEGFRIKKDGTRFWGSVAISAIHDENGEIIGFSKVTKDLTERKIADDRLAIFTHEMSMKNEELRQSEERYHRMISEVQDYAILMLNKEGVIQNWNTGAEYIKGYTAGEIIGKNFRIFYTESDREKRTPEKLLKEAETNGKATSEGWRKRKDGSRFWGSIVITALHDDTGAVIGFSKVTRDLTQKKIADDAIKKNSLDLEIKNIELEKLNAELSSFAYVVSHDLKEPVRKIQVFAGRLLEPDKSLEKLHEFAQKIGTSAARMQKLMESLLTYSQISKEQVEIETVDLNDVLETVKSDLELFISETNATIKSDNLPVIEGISYQLHQLFLNLILNSLKFSKPDSNPKIKIFSGIVSKNLLPEQLMIHDKKYYCMTFADNGIGFEQEQAARIFEVFQRVKPKKNQTGTGIGLSIVKKVIDNHGGCVVAEGKPDQGAMFKIYLPAEMHSHG